jgi:hypothetical protein
MKRFAILKLFFPKIFEYSYVSPENFLDYAYVSKIF